VADENQVTCIYCHTTGNREEIFVDPETGRERKFWHCLPRKLSGSVANLQAVCLPCAFRKRQELRNQFSDWFSEKKQLPVLVFTLEEEKRYAVQLEQATKRVERFIQENNLTPDKSKICSKCGKHHGQVFLASDYPQLHFQVVRVEKVRGRHSSVEAVMKNLLCLKCSDELLSKELVFWIERTLQFLQEKQEWRERLAALPGPDADTDKVTIVSKAIDPKYLPKSKRGKVLAKPTGTDGKA
jgi:hypothetical protein